MNAIDNPGQHPSRRSPNDSRRLFIGASVNGTRSEIIACTLGGEIHEHRVQDTGKSLEDVLDVLSRQILVMHTRLQAAGHDICALGLGVPGPVDVARGVLRYAEAIGWHESPVRQLLRQRLDDLGVPAIPFVVERAAACTALYYFASERLEDEGTLLYVHVGRSVAVATAASHGVLRGRHGLAGAIAHMQVVPDGPPCSCGRQGCANAVLTLPAMERACGLSAMDMQTHAGEERVQAVLRDTGKHLGRLLFELCLQYDPARLFVGGAAFQIDESFTRAATAQMNVLTGASGIPATPALQVIPFDRHNVALGAAIAALRQLWPIHSGLEGFRRCNESLVAVGEP